MSLNNNKYCNLFDLLDDIDPSINKHILHFSPPFQNSIGSSDVVAGKDPDDQEGRPGRGPATIKSTRGMYGTYDVGGMEQQLNNARFNFYIMGKCEPCYYN